MKTPRGGAGTDLILFILFIIVLGVVWVYTGGPDRSISHSGPFLAPPFGENSVFSIPSVGVGGNDYPTTTEDLADDLSVAEWLKRLAGGVNDLAEGEERSPYAEYVTLSVSTANSDEVEEEYLTLKTARDLSGTLTISGWRLESESGTTAILGHASQLPASGYVNSEQPVAVGTNTTVYIASGRSPIGPSFRVNLCTGYFAQHQPFEPRLQFECPLAAIELQNAVKRSPGYQPSPTCYSYISTLSQCASPTEQPPQNLEGQCVSVAFNDLTYNGCVSLHQGDPDFYKNEWRLYLNSDTELWANKKERIRLLDEAGRVVDVVRY